MEVATVKRGPYWRPGMNSRVEPWSALAEVSTGHLLTPCHRSSAHAHSVVEHWRALVDAGLRFDPFRVMVGAAVVDPSGVIVAHWGCCPTPGAPRWSPLMRLRDPAVCTRCRARRWPGCWVAVDLGGCSRCVPAVEAADPRVWPGEPPEPVVEALSGRSAPLA